MMIKTIIRSATLRHNKRMLGFMALLLIGTLCVASAAKPKEVVEPRTICFPEIQENLTGSFAMAFPQRIDNIYTLAKRGYVTDEQPMICVWLFHEHLWDMEKATCFSPATDLPPGGQFGIGYGVSSGMAGIWVLNIEHSVLFEDMWWRTPEQEDRPSKRTASRKTVDIVTIQLYTKDEDGNRVDLERYTVDTETWDR